MAAVWPALGPDTPAAGGPARPPWAVRRMFARPALRLAATDGSVSSWRPASGLAGGIGLPSAVFTFAFRSASLSLTSDGSPAAALAALIDFVSRKLALHPGRGEVAYDEHRLVIRPARR